MIRKNELFKTLKARGITLSLAESCTGGLLSDKLVESPGASEFFLGSVVPYTDGAKQRLLNVSKTLLEEKTAISSEVALQMALGIRKKLKSDWALGITGLAGPSRGTQRKPKGLVYYALVGPRFAKRFRKIFNQKLSRQGIRKRACEYGLEILIKNIC